MMPNAASINASTADLARLERQTPPNNTRQPDTVRPEPARKEAQDQVEISSAAQAYDAPAVAEPGMEQRIAEIKAQIAAGTYLTDDKLNAVVDKLHEEIFGGGR